MARAALYHAQCVTLVDWVLKKSLQGWPSNHEKGLFRTLPATVQDYRKNCQPLPTNASRTHRDTTRLSDDLLSVLTGPARPSMCTRTPSFKKGWVAS